MDFNEYQHKALSTAVYPHKYSVVYPLAGLAGESGEAIGKLSKVLRRDKSIDAAKESILEELGDCLWFIAVAAYDLDTPLETIAQRNIDKLADRKERGVIRGDGDTR